MTEMVERVARAMEEALRKSDDGAFLRFHDLKQATIDGHFDMLAVARAAIEAMRQPTLEMLEASAIAGQQATIGEIIGHKRWQAMIDAALNNPS